MHKMRSKNPSTSFHQCPICIGMLHICR